MIDDGASDRARFEVSHSVVMKLGRVYRSNIKLETRANAQRLARWETVRIHKCQAKVKIRTWNPTGLDLTTHSSYIIPKSIESLTYQFNQRNEAVNKWS